MFITLFITVQKQKPKYPSTTEWINQNENGKQFNNSKDWSNDITTQMTEICVQ